MPAIQLTSLARRPAPWRQWRALLVCGAIALILAPFVRRLDDATADISPVAGSESARVDRILATDFSSSLLDPSVLVITGLSQPANTDSGRAIVRALVAPLAASGFVDAVVSPATSLDTLLVGTDRTTAVALVGLRANVPFALDSARALTTRVAQQNSGIGLRWTGQAALVRDLRTFGATEARRAELRALPITAVVALIAFPTIGDAVIALVAAGLSVTITLGLFGLAAPLVPPSSFTRTIVPMVAMALTVDYVLYLRWRGRAGGERRALERTIALAACAVMIGFAGLAVAPTRDLRSAALAGAVACGVAAAVAVAMGRWTGGGVDERKGEPTAQRGNGENMRWRRWGAFVVERPWVVLVASVVPVLWLANGARGARLVTPLEQLLPAGMESADAFRDLQHANRAGAAGAVRVLISLPDSVLSPAGWTALQTATRALRAVPGAADARSLTTIGTGDRIVAQYVLPDEVKRAFVSSSKREAIVTVLPNVARGERESMALVRRIRALNAEQVTGVKGSELRVAGLAAYALDYESALRGALPWIVLATSLATFGALALLLRAPLVAAKAVALNLLVAAAAIGATVLVFQDGFGAALIGQHATGSIFPTVPVIAFGAAFGTSMDYELFLVGAVRDAWNSGSTAGDSIVVGVARTGGLITRAAGVMTCLFLAFSTSALLPLAMVGFALAVAVTLDATIVRLALAPAFLCVAGRWNWWPGPLFRNAQPH
jgi:putative drug exporter of the RND superfamily